MKAFFYGVIFGFLLFPNTAHTDTLDPRLAIDNQITSTAHLSGLKHQ